MTFKRISLWTMTAAVIAESGLKNVVLSALITVGTPAASAGFVYEVMQMRRATLEREAKDRASRASRGTASDMVRVSPGDPDQGGASQDGLADENLEHRLAVMLIARRQVLDLYGDGRQPIAPFYQKIVQGMLVADNQMLAELDAARKKGAQGASNELYDSESTLRGYHEQLASLLTPQAASHDAALDVTMR